MSTISQTGIPHARTVGFPLTITLGVDLTGATAVTLEIERRGAESRKVTRNLVMPGAITDDEAGVIVYNVESGTFPVGGGKYRVIVSIDFAPGETLVAEGDIDVEGD
jgi:hypothetical protein